MPADSDSDYGDADTHFVALLAGLDLADVATESPRPPRTPSPTLPPLVTVQRHTVPSIRDRIYTFPPTERLTMYHFESPTRRRVHNRMAAYVVFCGLRVGVFMTWRETSPLVTRVRNSIFRGYLSVAEAYAAFEYASARSWVHISNAPAVAAIPQLPQPTQTEPTPSPATWTPAIHVSFAPTFMSPILTLGFPTVLSAN
ncbi:hypothetical protein B0H13DRAFT_2666737 [Mycena leptocephala]|nr:hypothetical protein B0H13DRAFT_2666737 [Mycena leptocephala]